MLIGTKVCRYNWHSAGSLGWQFPMLKYYYIFQTALKDWFEITKMVIAVQEKNSLCNLLQFSAHFRSL